MAFRRRFPMRRRRFSSRRSSRADVQTLSLCGNVIQVGPTPQPIDCAHPIINVVPIMTGATVPAAATQPFETVHAVRGVSFKGARYQYLARTGALQNQTDPSLSIISTVYMHWVKMNVDTNAPTVPLFLPNLIIGTAPNATITPVGDPSVDVFHRHVFDIWTRPTDSCEAKCELGAFFVTDQYSQPTAHMESYSRPWVKDFIKTKRFLKENETIFLFTSIVSGLPADPNMFFLLGLDLHGHVAVKTRW